MDFIDQFLAGLEGDRSKGSSGSDRIVKLLMNANDYQGTVVVAPFMDPKSNQFYTLLSNVREFRSTCSLYSDGADEVWMKILPRTAYGELTPDQIALYEEITGLFDELKEKIGDDWSSIRTRTYTILQGILLRQVDTSNKQVKDNVGKACLFIYPSKSVLNALATAIDSKMVSMNGSKEWLPAVFSPDANNRAGVLSISFTRKDTGIGYDTSVAIDFNSAYNKVIPEEGFNADEVAKFDDVVANFLGWQNGEDGKFNTKMFTELKNTLMIRLKSVDTPAKTPVVENKNGVDPMLASQPAPQAVEQTVTSAPASDAPQQSSTVGGVKLPF